MARTKLLFLFFVFAAARTITFSVSASNEENGNVQVETEVFTKASTKAFLCYWGSWSFYRLGAEFSAQDIDALMCTHIIYSFAGINAAGRIHSADPNLDHSPDDVPAGTHNMFRKTVDLKKRNADLKVLIAVGGWNDEYRKSFSDMATTRLTRTIFINSTLDMINLFGFDGLDMDWEYPGVDRPEDKQNFAFLLEELRTAFDPRGYLLTSAVAVGRSTIDNAYNVPSISRSLHYLNIMAYDFKMYLEGSTRIGHQSALFSKQSELPEDQYLTVASAVEYYIRLGAPPEKMALGVPSYGRTYTLTSRDKHNFYDEAKGPGGKYTYSEIGMIQYHDICRSLAGNSNWEYHFDYDYYIPYMFNDTQWIGYDDEYSIMRKVDYAEEKGLGGMMLWSLEMDDCFNICQGWMSCPIAYTVKERMEYNAKRKSK